MNEDEGSLFLEDDSSCVSYLLPMNKIIIKCLGCTRRGIFSAYNCRHWNNSIGL